jgi:hypothetical protein
MMWSAVLCVISVFELHANSVFAFGFLHNHLSHFHMPCLARDLRPRYFELRSETRKSALKCNSVHEDQPGSDKNITRISLPESMLAKTDMPSIDMLGSDAIFEETVESKARRVFIGFAFVVATASWAKIQFEEELNDLQANLRSLSPQAADTFSQIVWGDQAPKKGTGTTLVRRKLDGQFASNLAVCILQTAISLRIVTDMPAFIKEERALATKALPFFAVSRPQGFDFDNGWAAAWNSEELANAALYARLRTLSQSLPSPLSRKSFLHALGARFLADRVLPAFDPASFPVADPLRESGAWLAGLAGLLAAYEAQGYAACSVGQRGAGTLDVERWEDRGQGELTIFAQDLALMPAAQALAGESLNDLAEALLPTCVVAAFLERCGVACDAEDYYISSAYTRNPAEYRPDSLLIQCNLSHRT